MTVTDTRKFQLEDAVRVHPTPDDGIAYGTIVGTITREAYEQDREYWGDVEGTGPLYLVNVGNVFTEEYEAVYAESALTPLQPNDSGIDELPRDAEGRPLPVFRDEPPF